MRVVLACLCDHAKADPLGKLDVIGIFDTLWAKEYPTVHPIMFLALRIELGFEDSHKTHRLEIDLVDEDGIATGGKVEGSMLPPEILPGKRVVINQLLTLQQIRIARPGSYTFRIRLDDNPPTEVRFDATLSQPAA